MSRPTKLTAEIQDAYVKALMVGTPPETAARKAGFSAPTLYRWLKGSSPDQLAFRPREATSPVARASPMTRRRGSARTALLRAHSIRAVEPAGRPAHRRRAAARLP